MSYPDTLTKAECEETVKATVRKQRLLFVALKELGRLPNFLVFGELRKDKGTPMGRWKYWLRRRGRGHEGVW